MNKPNTYNPLRTIDAGRLDGIIHSVIETENGLETNCGLDINLGDIMLLLQCPEHITCPKCRELTNLN